MQILIHGFQGQEPEGCPGGELELAARGTFIFVKKMSEYAILLSSLNC